MPFSTSGAAAPAVGVQSANEEETGQPLIVAFGDSLTAGYGLGAGLGYAPQLQDALRRSGLAARVVDAGVSGDTTSGGRARLDYVLGGLDRTPDLLILELGGNDMLRGVDPAITRDNLDAMLAELQRRDIPVVLMGMRAAPNYDPGFIAAFEAIYPDLAAQYDVPLYPFFLEGVAGVGDDEGAALMQADGVHPTFAGIKIMVSRTLDVVRGAL